MDRSKFANSRCACIRWHNWLSRWWRHNEPTWMQHSTYVHTALGPIFCTAYMASTLLRRQILKRKQFYADVRYLRPFRGIKWTLAPICLLTTSVLAAAIWQTTAVRRYYYSWPVVMFVTWPHSAKNSLYELLIYNAYSDSYRCLRCTVSPSTTVMHCGRPGIVKMPGGHSDSSKTQRVSSIEVFLHIAPSSTSRCPASVQDL